MSTITPADGGYKYYQRRIGELEDELKQQAERGRVNREEQRQRTEQAAVREIRDQETELHQAADRMREHMQETIQRERDTARAEVEAAKRAVYDRQGMAKKDIDVEKKRVEQALEDIHADYTNREKQLDKSQEARVRRMEETHTEKLEELTNANRKAWEEEGPAARLVVKQASNMMRDNAKTLAQERERVIRETEDNWRDQLHRLGMQRDQDVDQLQEKIRKTEAHDREKLNDALVTKDRQMSEAWSKLTRDAYEREKDVQDKFQKGYEDLNLRNAMDRAHSAKRMEEIAEKGSKNTEYALATQQKEMNESMKLQLASKQSEYDRLKQKYDDNRFATDSSKISATLANKLDEMYRKNASDALKAEHERNRGSEESLRQSFNTKYSEHKTQTDKETTQNKLRSEAEWAAERQRYREGMIDSEQRRQLEGVERSRAHESALSRTQKNNNRATNELVRRYEELLSAQQFDAQAKIAMLRQESEIEQKMTQRSFAARQTELIRESERKLADQKAEYEALLADAKAQSDAASRQREREHKLALEMQEKAFEKRLAQMELQQKERERIANNNYYSEIEKLKRSNAILSQKKS